jgi:hypothetical protein
MATLSIDPAVAGKARHIEAATTVRIPQNRFTIIPLSATVAGE